MAVVAGIRSLFKNHPRAAHVARWAGAATFLSAFLLVLFYSRAAFRSHLLDPSGFVEAGGAPAILGLGGDATAARCQARRSAVVSLLIDSGHVVDLPTWNKEDLPTDPAVLKRLQSGGRR